MKARDNIKDNIYAILYRREIASDGKYIFFPCQCVEGYFDSSDKSFIDVYGNIYYSCNNYTMFNTNQTFTYYYDSELNDIMNMMNTGDPETAVSMFYDKLKSNILIGNVNDQDKVIEIFELTGEKLESIISNVSFNTKDGKGKVTLTKAQLIEILKDSNSKDKIKVLLDKLDKMEKLSSSKDNTDLSVLITLSNLMSEKNISKAKEKEFSSSLEENTEPSKKVSDLSEEDKKMELSLIRDTTNDAYCYITSRMLGQDDSVQTVLGAIVNNIYAESPEQLIKPFIIGGTGSGKSYLFKLIHKGLDVPVIIVDCNQLVQSGYEGKMIDDVLKDLYLLCDRDLEMTEHAVVVFDEIDKIGDKGATVSEIGVQQTLLKFLEGQKYVVNMDKSELEKVVIDTSMMSIAACGAFEGLKDKEKSVGFAKSDTKEKITIEKLVKNCGMIPELLGRFNLYVEYNDVTEDMIRKQLEESESSPTKIKQDFYLQNYGVNLVFTKSFIDRLVSDAMKRKTGFRGVDQVVNQSLSQVNFKLQTSSPVYKEVVISEETINDPKKYVLK